MLKLWDLFDDRLSSFNVDFAAYHKDFNARDELLQMRVQLDPARRRLDTTTLLGISPAVTAEDSDWTDRPILVLCGYGR